MAKFAPRDNVTFDQKVMLRQTALQHVARPAIMETHGGLGDIYQAAYSNVPAGVVFEKDPHRSLILAAQRPAWAVYEADCVGALEKGAGAHLEINLLDVDPYGECWPAIRAFFSSTRPFAGRMIVVANDGLRQMVRGGNAWRSKTLSEAVEKYGNHRIWDIYLDVCYDLLAAAAQPAGYTIRFFDGYHTGRYKKMTHFLALLRQ